MEKKQKNILMLGAITATWIAVIIALVLNFFFNFDLYKILLIAIPLWIGITIAYYYFSLKLKF